MSGPIPRKQCPFLYIHKPSAEDIREDVLPRHGLYHDVLPLAQMKTPATADAPGYRESWGELAPWHVGGMQD